MKKVFAILLAAAMLLALAACGSKPAAEEPAETPSVSETPVEEAPVEEAPIESEEAAEPEAEPEVEEKHTVSYPIPGEHTLTLLACRRHMAAALGDGDYSSQYVYPELVKRTGVEIEFQMLAETTFSEQVNLIISAQDYPDIFGNGVGSYDSNIIKAIEDEVVIDLMEYLPEYAPDYYAIIEKYEDFGDMVRNSDGSITSFESCNVGVQSQGLYLRGDWMEELGLEVPTTIDEFTAVMEAFHTAYDTPMTLLVNTDLNDGLYYAFDHPEMGLSISRLPFQQSAPNSGVVIPSVASDGYFNHLTLLREYYEKGLINDDFLSISKENGNFESSFYSGVCGAWYDGAELADPSYAKNSNDPDWYGMPILRPVYNGEETHMVTFAEHSRGPSGLIVSAGCEIPEIAVQYLNYGYTEEGKILVSYGIEGETFVRNEDGSISYTELLTEHPESIRSAEWVYLVKSWLQTEQDENGAYMMYGEAATAACKMWTEEAKNSDGSMALPTSLSLTAEENEQISQYVTDICTYLAEFSNKYIMGIVSADEFKEAIENANDLGLGEVTAVYQAAFDRCE